jgi:hypothetical protein
LTLSQSSDLGLDNGAKLIIIVFLAVFFIGLALAVFCIYYDVSIGLKWPDQEESKLLDETKESADFEGRATRGRAKQGSDNSDHEGGDAEDLEGLLQI